MYLAKLSILLSCMLLVSVVHSDHSVNYGDTNMNSVMQEEAMEATRTATDTHRNWTDRKSHIEQHFNSKYGANWHCLIGRSGRFSVRVPENLGTFFVFQRDGIDVVLYNTTGDEDIYDSCETVLQKQDEDCQANILTLKMNIEKWNDYLSKKVETLTEDNHMKNVKQNSTLLDIVSISRTLDELHSEVAELSPSLQAQKKLHDCLSSAVKLSDRLMTALSEKQSALTQHNKCRSRIYFLQNQRTSALISNHSTAYVAMKHNRRLMERDVAVISTNDNQFAAAAGNFAKTLLPNTTDVQEIARRIYDRFQTWYPTARAYCFVVDRDPEYGVEHGYKNHDYYNWRNNWKWAIFSVNGISVSLFVGNIP